MFYSFYFFADCSVANSVSSHRWYFIDYYTLNSLTLILIGRKRLGKGYESQSSASDDDPCLFLDYSRYHKTLIQ